MCWYGADPGGIKSFGVAALKNDGSFETWLCSSTDDALAKIIRPAGVGIDCPLWWSSGEGGGRRADRWIREKYKIAAGTVQSVNSLKGAVLVQGLLLAMMLRKAHPNLPITESHPKALLLALRKDWKAFSESFGLDGPAPPTEHERDAVIAAVAVREGSLGRWKLDLALHLGPSEIDPKAAWFGEVHYWWPAEMYGDEEAPKPNALAHVDLKSKASTSTGAKSCPECHHVFQGKGWSGMDAHWKAKHEHLKPYAEAWPLIEAGKYNSANGK